MSVPPGASDPDTAAAPVEGSRPKRGISEG